MSGSFSNASNPELHDQAAPLQALPRISRRAAGPVKLSGLPERAGCGQRHLLDLLKFALFARIAPHCFGLDLEAQ